VASFVTPFRQKMSEVLPEEALLSYVRNYHT